MFGREFLVAPVVTAGTERATVYLPNRVAGWFDFWSGQHFADGRSVEVDAKLDQIPLFVPAGSILPFGPKEQFVSEKPADPIELRVYPGADATFTLYEDEGTNYNYDHGNFSTIELKWNDRKFEIEIGKRFGSFPHMLQERKFSMHVAGSSSKPRIVEYRGEVLRISMK